MKQLAFAWPQAEQKPLALSFQVPALALPDCSSGSRVIFPSGVKVILNFAPEGDAAVNGCPPCPVRSLRDYLARNLPQAFEDPCWRAVDCHTRKSQKMSIGPPEYKPPPRTTYTDLGWIFAALSGPVTLLAVWIYCAVTYGFFFGFGLGWIPALILALLVVVATIFLWPLAAIAVLYVIYRVFGVHPELLIYIAALVGIIAIAMIWWRHAGNNKL